MQVGEMKDSQKLRVCFFIEVGFFIIVCSLVAPGCGTVETSAFRQVSRLEPADAVVAMKGDSLRLVRVGDSLEEADRAAVYDEWAHHYNGELVSRQAQGDFIFAHGNTIYLITPDGDARIWREVSPQDFDGKVRGTINWFAHWDEATQSFVAAVVNGGSKGASGICWIPKEGQFACIPVDFPTSRSITLSSRKLYSVGMFPPELSVWRIDGFNRVDSVPLQHRYSSIELDSSGRRLLLSTSVLHPQPQVTILEPDSNRARRLPIAGGYARWRTQEKIVYIKHKNELWEYDLVEERSSPLVRLGEQCGDEGSSYASTPEVSPHGRFVAWSWCVLEDGKQRTGTAVVDFNRREFQLFSLYAPDVAWLQQ